MNLLFFKHEKKFLSAEEARNILKYGFRGVTFQEVFEKEVSDIEASIKVKSSSGFRILTSTYPDYKRDLVEELAKHFRENGFKVDIYENPEVEGFILLIIGW
jgi:hypothetical protein